MDTLKQYHEKRNFESTEEPKGKLKIKRDKKLRFVVQRHHASRLHYDFRLEVAGVLKSWAVPKGPSLFPTDKRLAVQVEDHPVDYANFEGTIPEGNYGAGTVSVFDKGYYEPLNGQDEDTFLSNLADGSIKFVLHGDKLKGEFALVRIKSDQEGKSWLLIKHKDEYATEVSYNAEDAVPEKIKKEGLEYKKVGAKKKSKRIAKPSNNSEPELAQLSPMLAKLTDAMPEGNDWLFEKKFDGFRIIAVKKDEHIFLYSRNGKNMNKLFPSILKELMALNRNVWLDGEVVIEDSTGKSYFQMLATGEPLGSSYQLHYYIFDILNLDENDLSQYPLSERKELLTLFFKGFKSQMIELVNLLKGTPMSIYRQAERKGWEGVIAKDLTSFYHAGKRSNQWLKIKIRQSQEAVICGFTKPQGNRSSFGALVLGCYDNSELTYLGNCGTGFNDELLEILMDKLKVLIISKKPFPQDVSVAKEKEVTWVKPDLVCEVYYSEWTMEHHLRHPVFKGLRTDKKAKEIVMEEVRNEMVKEKIISINRHRVKLTNLDKIYWPDEGYVKGEMLEYYEQYGDLLLPYLKDKPISLHRFPNGIGADGFFQKDVDLKQIPDWVKTVPIYAESTDKNIDYMVCNNKATLLFIANLGSIEINPWLSTYKKIENPDFAVLDIDPNGADFDSVIEIGLTAHRIFQQVGVADYIKTSGSTGLHIYLYVKQRYTYEVVRDFIQLIGEMIHEEHPDTTSLIRDPKKRKGLIYLDFLQNRRGQTIAAPYSIRPKPGATISTPLHWEEVKKGLDIRQFNLKTITERLKKVEDPWKTFFDTPSNIKEALANL